MQPLTPSIVSLPHPVHHHRKRKQTPSDLLELFAMLSLHLLLDIMYRLSVKSLSKLKCVSKPLNYIISDPKFVKDHLRLLQTRHYNLLLCPCGLFSKEFNLFESPLPFVLNHSTSTIPWTKLNFPIKPCDNPCIIVDSCDDIICFETRDYNHVNVVGNPYTGKVKILPPLENLHNCTTQTIYIIGYDRFIDKYKVVAVNRDQCRSSFNFCKTQVRVHTLGTNFWRRILDFPSEIIGVPKGYVGKHVSGTINWAIRNQAIICSSWVILSLEETSLIKRFRSPILV